MTIDPNDSPAAERPRLFLVHIPKTGGTTFKRTLNDVRWLDGHRAWLDHDFDPALNPGFEGSIRVSGGHRTWEHYGVLPGNWSPVVLLRDPLQRTLSHYSFVRKRFARNELPPDFRPLGQEVATRSLPDLVRDPNSRFFGWSGSIQTRFIAGESPNRPPGAESPAGLLDPRAMRRALMVAMERLEETVWIGRTEHLARDLQTLAIQQGWPSLGPVRHANMVHPSCRVQPEDLDGETLRSLEERLEADYLLVDRAEEIARERHHAAVEGLLALRGRVP